MPDRKSFSDTLEQPLIIAHRGASAYTAENTLAAFRLAIEQGADAIELDAQLTADGQVVVMHDDTVDRTTNGSGKVKSLTLAEIQSLDASAKSFQAPNPEFVPSLANVFRSIGQEILINVELKNYTSPTDNLPDKVVALVMEYNLEDRVLLSSFNMLALIKARKILPKVHLGLLTFSGLGDATLRLKLIRFSELFALNPHYEDITPGLVRIAHKTRSKVFTYPVKQPEVMRRVINAGVDGIITPDPLMAQHILSGMI
jgi:glycerophosphoryl diester phosphodiesterase